MPSLSLILPAGSSPQGQLCLPATAMEDLPSSLPHTLTSNHQKLIWPVTKYKRDETLLAVTLGGSTAPCPGEAKWSPEAASSTLCSWSSTHFGWRLRSAKNSSCSHFSVDETEVLSNMHVLHSPTPCCSSLSGVSLPRTSTLDAVTSVLPSHDSFTLFTSVSPTPRPAPGTSRIL